MAAAEFTITVTRDEAQRALAELIATTFLQHSERACCRGSLCARGRALRDLAAEHTARAMPRTPGATPMAPGRTVPLREWLDRLTPEERDELHYLIRSIDKNGRTQLTLPDPDGEEQDLLTEREQNTLRRFYARQAR